MWPVPLQNGTHLGVDGRHVIHFLELLPDQIQFLGTERASMQEFHAQKPPASCSGSNSATLWQFPGNYSPRMGWSRAGCLAGMPVADGGQSALSGPIKMPRRGDVSVRSASVATVSAHSRADCLNLLC